jgi:hypothetical protein
MMGLVIETGRLVARSREVQTAADSAALVAAEMLNRQSTNTVARTTAVNFVSTHNGVTPGSVLVNMPPTTGPFANQSGFAEAKITYWLETPLGRLLNASHQTPLHARALAGPKPTPWKDVLLALDTLSVPGIAATGTGQLRIEGDCATNSHGGGIDENGGTVSGLPGYGAEVSLAGSLLAHQVRVTGGVNAPGNFSGLAAGDTKPPEPRTVSASWIGVAFAAQPQQHRSSPNRACIPKSSSRPGPSRFNRASMSSVADPSR